MSAQAAIAATAPVASAAWTPKGQLHELTSMRFFAALAVLLGHFNPFIGLPTWISFMTGGFGVSFFFVLSGFILTYRYWDDFSSQVDAHAYRRYFAARIARIYPSYVLALVLITLLYLAIRHVNPAGITFPGNTVVSWLVNLFAIQTFARSYETQQMWNAPSWSISTEFGFYVLCPFILFMLARWFRSGRGLVGVFAAVMLFGVAMQTAALYAVFDLGWNRELWLDIVASRNIVWRIPEFMAGVVSARLLYGGHLEWLRSASARNALLTASLVAVAVLNLAPWPQDGTALLVMRQYRLDLGYMIPFAGIVLALAAGPTLLSPLLRRPGMVFLGESSYALYIYHWIPWTATAHYHAAGFETPISLVTGVITVTILLSAASYIWYERPTRLYLRRKLA